jgi:hypothetical protein
VGRPKALNHKQLRRAVDRIWESTLAIQDTDHPEKHPTLTIADAFLSLRDSWTDLEHRWDNTRKAWKYIVNTIGMDGRRVTTVFVPHKDWIEIVTRYQDDYAKRYKTPHSSVHKP